MSSIAENPACSSFSLRLKNFRWLNTTRDRDIATIAAFLTHGAAARCCGGRPVGTGAQNKVKETMQRRKFVIGLGALAAGGAAATGTGAFSAALVNDRDANITVSGDSDALLALVPGYDLVEESTVSEDTVAMEGNQLAIDIGADKDIPSLERGHTTHGVNVGSTYQIGAIAGDEKDVLDRADQVDEIDSDDVIYGKEDDQFFEPKDTSDDPAFGIINNTNNDVVAQLNWEATNDPDGVNAALVVDGDEDPDLGDGWASSWALGLDDQPAGETTFGIDSGNAAYVSLIIVTEDDAAPEDLSGTLELRAEGSVRQ